MNPPIIDENQNEFLELIEAETYVDIERLRDMSRHGIPDDLRASVWKYLLGVNPGDKAEQMKREHIYFQSVKQQQLQNNSSLGLFYYSKRQNIILSVVQQSLNQSKIKHYTIEELLYLLRPFESVYMSDPIQPNDGKDLEKNIHDMYRCFEVFLQKNYFKESLSYQVAKLITLFKCTQPDLYQYFVNEEVEPNEWCLPWIKYLLSKQLPLDCVRRLWDTYFSTNDFDLHIYVCLAILQYYNETLMELEYSEIKYFLNNIYTIDKSTEDGENSLIRIIPHILKQAYNFRAYVKSRQLI
ncbi:predicted protein [Naegleria gruberi]|uniref:Predicted protein n=1 Tax=Naegleria gruberi TaxID=5762 RepID=D2VCQ9_NAEGR|nr:uncharacterized protein NAEGRDRAFT_44505 [Naegleria gruberi]EFC45351.1 predicted protein [Naegleria gruberi]|eukprot:XP_002678095.1 predicted protein [Naegleria gruberi strain NEG-M]